MKIIININNLSFQIIVKKTVDKNVDNEYNMNGLVRKGSEQ